MTQIELKGGYTMLVDAADVAMLSGFTIQVSGGPDGYPYARADRGKMQVLVHRLIAGAGADDIVDHHNRNTLDNRTANLRITNRSGNGANRGADRRRAGTSSRHKGVVRKEKKMGNRWMAYIHVNGKTNYLGTYDTEDEAAEVYNRAALEAWGEMARLNITGGDAS